MLSMLSFSRYVERCKVIDSYRCKSLSSGKIFHFSEPWFYGRAFNDAILKITFEGKGYKNLELIDFN